MDVLCGEGPSRHLTLLVRDGRGWSNLCRILTLAHAHTREGGSRRELGEAQLDVQGLLDHAEGLVLPERLRLALGAAAPRRRGGGPGGPTSPSPAGCSTLRPGGLLRRAPAPVPAPRPRPQPRAGGARAAAGGALRGDRQRPRPRPLPGRAAGRLRGAAQPRHARRLRAAAPGQPQPRDELAAGDGTALRRASRGGPGDPAAGRAADVRPAQGPRLPLPRRRAAERLQAPGGALSRSACRSATATAPRRPLGRCARRRTRAWSRSWP